MKKANISIETYDYKNGFRVEIYLEPTDNTWQSFVYHVDCGIKLFMFGFDSEENTKDEFIDFVLDSLDEYVKLYKEEYME